MDFGWDWSLAVAPQGLFGEIKILKDNLVLENPQVIQKVDIGKYEN